MKYIPQYVYYNLLAHVLFLTSSYVLVSVLYITVIELFGEHETMIKSKFYLYLISFGEIKEMKYEDIDIDISQ